MPNKTAGTLDKLRPSTPTFYLENFTEEAVGYFLEIKALHPVRTPMVEIVGKSFDECIEVYFFRVAVIWRWFVWIDLVGDKRLPLVAQFATSSHKSGRV